MGSTYRIYIFSYAGAILQYYLSTIPDGSYGAGAAAEKSAWGRKVCDRCMCWSSDVSRPEVYSWFKFFCLELIFVLYNIFPLSYICVLNIFSCLFCKYPSIPMRYVVASVSGAAEICGRLARGRPFSAARGRPFIFFLVRTFVFKYIFLSIF